MNHKLEGELRGRQRLKLKQRHSVLPAVAGDRRPREATSNGLTLDDDHQHCKPIITPTTLHLGLPSNTRAWSKRASSSLIHSNHSYCNNLWILDLSILLLVDLFRVCLWVVSTCVLICLLLLMDWVHILDFYLQDFSSCRVPPPPLLCHWVPYGISKGSCWKQFQTGSSIVLFGSWFNLRTYFLSVFISSYKYNGKVGASKTISVHSDESLRLKSFSNLV